MSKNDGINRRKKGNLARIKRLSPPFFVLLHKNNSNFSKF